MVDRLRNLLATAGPLLGLALVYAIFLVAAPESFHSLYNTKTFVTQSVIVGVGALGMTVVIVSGGIDLSVGSLVALGTVVTASILKAYGGAEMGVLLPLVAALAAVAVAALCGLLSGSIISGLGIVPFIVTLGMMQIVRGVAKGLARQSTVNAPPSWLGELMIVEPSPHTWYSVAPGVWVLLGLTVAMWLVLRYTRFGRHTFALGSNQQTARLCGVRVRLLRVGIYTVGGAFAGLASVMQFSTLAVGDPAAATGMELDIIAAVVIGGGSLNGGEGSVVGSIVGALIMAVLRNGCSLVGIPTYVQNIVIGAIIIVAVGVDRLRRRDVY